MVIFSHRYHDSDSITCSIFVFGMSYGSNGTQRNLPRHAPLISVFTYFEMGVFLKTTSEYIALY